MAKKPVTTSSDIHGAHAPWLLGPRAIAMLSCALALLAANPAMVPARFAAPATMRVVRAEGLVDLAEAPADGVKTDATTRVRKATRPGAIQVRGTAASIGRDGRMLETLAAWSDLLAREFAGLVGPAQHAVWMPAQGAFASVENSQPQATRRIGIEPMPAPHESEFAIHHCLLAPPTTI